MYQFGYSKAKIMSLRSTPGMICILVRIMKNQLKYCIWIIRRRFHTCSPHKAVSSAIIIIAFAVIMPTNVIFVSTRFISTSYIENNPNLWEILRFECYFENIYVRIYKWIIPFIWGPKLTTRLKMKFRFAIHSLLLEVKWLIVSYMNFQKWSLLQRMGRKQNLL